MPGLYLSRLLYVLLGFSRQSSIYVSYFRQDNPKIELPSMPMSTRGSDRIAQLISSTWYNNIASGVMADIVQKHLSTEKELENTDNHLSTEKELDKTDKVPGEIMRDIENQLMVEREPQSDDTPTAAVDKTTLVGDNLATREPLMIDFEKLLFVQGEPHSNDESAVAAKKNTIVR